MESVKSREFAAALWADSWEKACNAEPGCVQGTVSFHEEMGIRLDLPFGELFQNPGVVVIGGDELPKSLDWLYGFSQDGHRIALGDAHSIGARNSCPGGSHQTVGASQILFSKGDFDPARPVVGVTLELKGLAEWFGDSPLEKVMHIKDGRAQDILVSAALGDEGHNKTLYEGESLSVHICHSVTTSGCPESGFTVGHKCMLGVDLHHARPLADARATAFRVADFFSFCAGFCAEIEKMTFSFDGGSSAECLVRCVKGRAPSKVYAHQMVFPYAEIAEEVGPMLGIWLAEGDALRDPSSLLVSLLTRGWVLPIDLTFVAAAQMLESLCRVRADLRSMGEEEFEAFKAAVMAALDGIEDRHIANMAKERIHPGNGKGQRRLISEFVDRHRTAASCVFGDPDAFASRHIYLRNALTHREGEPAVDAVDLVRHTEGILLFSYCSVAELLGLSPDAVARRVEGSGFRNVSLYECRKLYPAKPAKGGEPG